MREGPGIVLGGQGRGGDGLGELGHEELLGRRWENRTSRRMSALGVVRIGRFPGGPGNSSRSRAGTSVLEVGLFLSPAIAIGAGRGAQEMGRRYDNGVAESDRSTSMSQRERFWSEPFLLIAVGRSHTVFEVSMLPSSARIASVPLR